MSYYDYIVINRPDKEKEIVQVKLWNNELMAYTVGSCVPSIEIDAINTNTYTVYTEEGYYVFVRNNTIIDITKNKQPTHIVVDKWGRPYTSDAYTKNHPFRPSNFYNDSNCLNDLNSFDNRDEYIDLLVVALITKYNDAWRTKYDVNGNTKPETVFVGVNLPHLNNNPTFAFSINSKYWDMLDNIPTIVRVPTNPTLMMDHPAQLEWLIKYNTLDQPQTPSLYPSADEVKRYRDVTHRSLKQCKTELTVKNMLDALEAEPQTTTTKILKFLLKKSYDS